VPDDSRFGHTHSARGTHHSQRHHPAHPERPRGPGPGRAPGPRHPGPARSACGSRRPYPADAPTLRMQTAVPAAQRTPSRAEHVLCALVTEPFTVVLPPARRPGAEPAPAATARRGGLGEGLALSLSSGLGALAGLASWLIAARLLPQAEFGLAAAVVSAFMLVGGISQLNLGLALMRWLPVAGRHVGTLVRRSLLVIMPLAAAAGLGYVLVVPALARTAAGPDGPLAVGAAVFVAAAAAWGAFVVHDYVLVAIGRPWWSVWRNGLFAVVRIGLLVVLGSSLGAQGVVLSWAGPLVVWIAAGSLVLLVAVRRCGQRGSGGTVPGRSEVVGFLGPTWLAQIGNTLLLNQVPLLVILRFGPEPGAAFFVAWQATVVVETAATYFTHSLSATCARAPERVDELVSATRRQMLLIFLPLLALGALLARPGLSIFGTGYAATAAVLQLLLLGQAFRLLVVHELGVRTATGRGVAYARLHLSSTVLVLLAVVLAPAPAEGGDGATLLPVAWGYVAVQVACAGHVVLVRALGRRRLNRAR
jgi:O-antigen/teichoic acid export membrane protein